MFKYISLPLILLLLVFTNPALAEKQTPAPHPLPRVESHMNSAGFWISRHPSPDTLIMTPMKIREFNAHIRDNLKLTRDIFKTETFLPSISLKDLFEKTNRDIESKKYFDAQGLQPKEKFFKPLLQNTNQDKTFEPQYGLVVRFTDERILPTADGLYEEPGDIEFDQLQNSGLDIGTPVLILHYSQDNKWVYEMNEISEGWIRAEDIAIGDLKSVQDYAEAAAFVVVTKPKADIYHDERRTNFIGTIRMGSRLPLSPDTNSATVQIPARDESGKLIFTHGRLNANEIREGYVPFIARNLFQQAFAMLHQPYGWGDAHGEQDCSRFLQEVFAAFGIKLPRNSKEQAQTGLAAATFDDSTTDPQKQDILAGLGRNIYILTMKGHIMLYVGSIDKNAYAIHDAHAYREKTPDGDVARVIHRVAVTDLNLGEGSQKGSLLRRLTGVREINFSSDNQTTLSPKEEQPHE